ncbi:sigma-70 family RNA polymerase sigma factor family protein [Streptomyces luteogriseus]|uniref:hypothetical protein n=1 Tax=Streptomyces luteogriseus TaxID=68233 RepID=UPI0036919B9D
MAVDDRAAREGGRLAALRIAAGSGQFEVDAEDQVIEGLIGVLAPDATAIGDGGGLVPAALHPVEGAEQVARFFAGRARAVPGISLEECAVNGRPGLVARKDGVTVSVPACDIAGDRIQRVWAVLNPDKLRPWTAR